MEHTLPVDQGAKRVRPVVNHLQPVVFRDALDAHHVARNSEAVGGKNRRSPRRDLALEVLQVNVVPVRLNVHKNRSASAPVDAACRGNVREGCREYFSG